MHEKPNCFAFSIDITVRIKFRIQLFREVAFIVTYSYWLSTLHKKHSSALIFIISATVLKVGLANFTHSYIIML